MQSALRVWLNRGKSAIGMIVRKSLQPFLTVEEVEADPQSYRFSAFGLRSGITVTASTGFALSTTEGGTYSSVLTLAANYNGYIWVKMTVVAVGEQSGTLTHSSAGKSDIVISVGGEVTSTDVVLTVDSDGITGAFNTEEETPSAAQTMTVAGENLTADVVITKPAGSDFEFSLSAGSGYANPLNLTPTEGTLAETTVYVRLAGVALGEWDGNIVVSSSGATPVNVAVNGVTSEILPELTLVENGITGGFSTVSGEVSDPPQTITISGVNLASDVTITKPAGSDFEFCLTENGTYANPLVLSPTEGVLAETDIYIRLAGETEGSWSGNIAITSSGATGVNVAVVGVTSEVRAKWSGDYLYVRSRFNATQDVVKVMVVYGAAVGGSQLAWNFYQTRLIPHTNIVGDYETDKLIIAGEGDDNAPFGFNSGLIGGQHGFPVRKLTFATAHGLTTAAHNIGTTWTDQNNVVFTIVGIPDATSILVMNDVTGTGDLYNQCTACYGSGAGSQDGTLTEVSPGVRSLIWSAQASEYLIPGSVAWQTNDVSILADGTTPVTQGSDSMPCQYLEVTANYYLLHMPDVRAYCVTNKETITTNLTNAMMAQAVADAVIGKTATIAQTFKYHANGGVALNQTVTFHKSVAAGRIYGALMNKLTPKAGESIYYYAPKVAPSATKSANGYAINHNYQAIPGDSEVTIWEPKNTELDNIANYNDRIVIGSRDVGAGITSMQQVMGFSLETGDSVQAIREILTERMWVTISMQKFDMILLNSANITAPKTYAMSLYRKLYDPKVMSNNASSAYWVVMDGITYLYLDYHADCTDTITLPAAFAGKGFYVIEKSATISVDMDQTPLAAAELEVVADVGASPNNYGYCVIKLLDTDGKVETPTLDPAAGAYATNQTVTIATTTPGATIHYTTNGDTPTSGSATYSAPVTVTLGQTLKAIAVKSGWTDSDVASGAYTASTYQIPIKAVGTGAGEQTFGVGNSNAGGCTIYVTSGTIKSVSSGTVAGDGKSATIPQCSNGVKITITLNAYGAGTPTDTIGISNPSTIHYLYFSEISNGASPYGWTGALPAALTYGYFAGANLGYSSTDALPSTMQSIQITAAGYSWSNNAALPTGLVTVYFNGAGINWTGTTVAGTGNINTFSLSNWRTSAVSAADLIALLTSMAGRAGNLPATCTVKEYDNSPTTTDITAASANVSGTTAEQIKYWIGQVLAHASVTKVTLNTTDYND